MSRLIVKNLPKKVSEQQIISHFSKFGEVTDVKLKYKQNGDFRQFAFIGFESEEVASNACSYFQNTYFNQSKIIVEKCQDLDHKLKKADDINTNTVKDIDEKSKNIFNKIVTRKKQITDQKLKELIKNQDFIQYLKCNKKNASDFINSLKIKYGNADVDENISEKCNQESEEESEKKSINGDNETEDQEQCEEKLANKHISDLEYFQGLIKSSKGDNEHIPNKLDKAKKWKDLFTIVIRTKEQLTSKEKKGKTITKQGVKEFLKPLAIKSLRIPHDLSFVAYIGFKTEKERDQALLKDKSFLDGVRVRIHKRENKDGDEDILKDGNTPWKAAEEKLATTADPIGESGKLFVRNLWYSVTEENLKELFEKIGPVSDVTLPVSKLTRKPKGFAHISYIFPEHAVKAMNELDGSSFQGRVLHILPSLIEENKDLEEKSFKERKKEEQKKSASSWHNWNSLFLGSGAVIDLISQTTHASKQKIFREEGNRSVAVNLAIGETQIVDDTKRFLEEEGISLEAFTHPNVQRSSTTILVKNLPARTVAKELRELFGRHGELGRVVLPPSGITAVIEFLDSGEAKRAFQELAYSRFKYLPLYLEWAPIEVFKTAAVVQKPKVSPAEQELSKSNDQVEQNNNEALEDVVPDLNTTLYVKNLNFKTEEDEIRKHFSKIGQVHTVLISKRRGLSQGYGFVQFVRASDASSALRKLQNSCLDGHNLTIKLSEKKLNASPAKGVRKFQSTVGEDEASTKLLVKNIPFQATSKEIRQLFEVFGALKNVRLPMKFGSSEHRGFGFVEFLTKESAEKALKALGASTHLYGRRLALEWAKGESIEELRRKTADHFMTSGPPNKRQKIEVPGNVKTSFGD